MRFTFLDPTMRELGIAAVFLFGSQAQGAARADSDYDFGILLNKLVSRREKNRIYDTLYDIIAPQIGRPATIDLVFVDDADLQFRFHIARDGQVIYADESGRVGDFLEKTVEEYADFAPYRRQFHAAILARV